MLRSDELANQEQVERDQKFRSNVGKGVKAATGLATGALASRVMPFLNEYIPAGLAMKGINAVSPKLGSFLKKGQEMGLNIEEGVSFLKDKLAPKDRNIIEQYSPELHQFMSEQVKSGRPALEAGAVAQNDKRFAKAIEKMSKDHKTPWSNILQSVYGNEQQAPQQAQQEPQGQQQPGQAQPGQGQQALMAMIQKLQQMRGGQ